MFLAGHKVITECDNKGVVSVLTYGRTRDAFLAVSALNVCQVAAIYDIEVMHKHIICANNDMAHLLFH